MVTHLGCDYEYERTFQSRPYGVSQLIRGSFYFTLGLLAIIGDSIFNRRDKPNKLEQVGED